MLATVDTQGITSPADDVIPDTRQIADTTTTHQDNRVFLEIVALAWNINRDFAPIGEPNTRDLPQSRVGLLGSHRANDEANSLLERTLFQHGGLAENAFLSPGLANELINRGHTSLRVTFGLLIGNP